MIKINRMACPSDHFAEAHDGLAGIMGYLLNVDVPPCVKQGILRNTKKIYKNLVENEEKLRALQIFNSKLMATRRIKNGAWSLCPETADVLLSKQREHKKRDEQNKRTERTRTSARELEPNKEEPRTGNDQNGLLQSAPWRIDNLQ